MGKAAIRLPEKLYFTVEEIAQRWNCEESTIWHYINEGMLRPAIESIQLDEAWVFDDPEGITGGLWWEPLEAWRKADGDAEWTEVKDKVVFWHNLPRFMYFDARNRTPGAGSCIGSKLDEIWDGKIWGITVVETLQGKEYTITQWPPPTGIGSTTCKPYRLDITELYNSPIITREERDRFEREHGIVVDGQAATAEAAEPQQKASAGGIVFPYATRELEAMREAVRQHWEDYTPDKRQPTQKEIAYTLGELLGLPTQGDGTPARKALTLAAAIKPDTLPDT